MMKKYLPVLVAIFAIYVAYTESQPNTESVNDAKAVNNTERYGRADSDRQVVGQGVVARVLPDDNEGSRHQRFILRLASGQTVLIAHNIDLAPRIGNLRQGDTVRFNGEYEWNDRGGVIHWTHRDPQNRHEHGWLEHSGRRYE